MHLSTHTWMRPEPLEKTLQRASSLGFQSIELAGEPDKYPVDQCRRLLDKYHMKCWGTVTIMHTTRDLIAADAQQRADTIEYIKRVIAMSAALGGQIVTVVPSTVGKLTPQSTPQAEWTWAVEGLRQLCAYAEGNHVKVAIEPLNRFETYFINRTDQALALADAVGHSCCGVAFDPFHLNIEERDMFEATRSCGSRIFDVHLGDNNRLAPGDGTIDWAKFITTLRAIGYQGGLANESMPPIDRTPASPYIDVGGQLETEPGEVDKATLQFLEDHGSGVLSDSYYTKVLQRVSETILPLLAA